MACIGEEADAGCAHDGKSTNYPKADDHGCGGGDIIAIVSGGSIEAKMIRTIFASQTIPDSW